LWSYAFDDDTTTEEDYKIKVGKPGSLWFAIPYYCVLAAVYGLHIYMMIEPLHLWGEFNVYYIGTTLFLTS